MAQNQVEAVKWYRKAAEQGYADAQNNLGLMQAKGTGVAQNFSQSYIWLSLATAQDNKYREARDIVAKKLTSQQLQRAQDQASAWKPKPER